MGQIIEEESKVADATSTFLTSEADAFKLYKKACDLEDEGNLADGFVELLLIVL